MFLRKHNDKKDFVKKSPLLGLQAAQQKNALGISRYNDRARATLNSLNMPPLAAKITA